MRDEGYGIKRLGDWEIGRLRDKSLRDKRLRDWSNLYSLFPTPIPAPSLNLSTG